MSYNFVLQITSQFMWKFIWQAIPNSHVFKMYILGFSRMTLYFENMLIWNGLLNKLSPKLRCNLSDKIIRHCNLCETLFGKICSLGERLFYKSFQTCMFSKYMYILLNLKNVYFENMWIRNFLSNKLSPKLRCNMSDKIVWHCSLGETLFCRTWQLMWAFIRQSVTNSHVFKMYIFQI